MSAELRPRAMATPLGCAILLALVADAAADAAAPGSGAITVFVAKKIITMDPTRPTATTVAVRDGRILAVGSLDDVVPCLATGEYTVDSWFKDGVAVALHSDFAMAQARRATREP